MPMLFVRRMRKPTDGRDGVASDMGRLLAVWINKTTPGGDADSNCVLAPLFIR